MEDSNRTEEVYDNFDIQMIRNQNQLLKDITFLSQRMESFENQLETLINGQHSIIGTINRVMKKKTRQAVRKPKELKLIKQKSKPLSLSDVSKLVHLPEALQRNISKFTQNILFTSSNIQDDLLSNHCLSEDECTDISSKANPKDQVRLLIRKIKSRGPDSIDKFLKAVEKDKPELVKEVYKTLDNIVNEYKDKPVCAICVMQNTVDLKDIADTLWQEKIISDNIFEDIIVSNSLHQSRPLIWSSIMSSLNDFTDHGKAKAILIDALKPKYDHIVGYINQNPDRPSLNCWCCTKCRRLQPRPLVSEFGSQTNVSLSSSKLPKVLDNDNLSEDGISSTQDLPSNDLLSYDMPEAFEDISTNLSEIQSNIVDSTSSTCHASGTVTGNVNENNQESFSQHYVPDADDNSECSSQEREIKEKQELHHSVSTISNTSTLTAEISSSSPSTAGIQSSKNIFMQDMTNDMNSFNSYSSTKEVNKPLSNGDSTIENQPNSDFQGAVNNLPIDQNDKDNTFNADGEEILTDTTGKPVLKELKLTQKHSGRADDHHEILYTNFNQGKNAKTKGCEEDNFGINDNKNDKSIDMEFYFHQGLFEDKPCTVAADIDDFIATDNTDNNVKDMGDNIHKNYAIYEDQYIDGATVNNDNEIKRSDNCTAKDIGYKKKQEMNDGITEDHKEKNTVDCIDTDDTNKKGINDNKDISNLNNSLVKSDIDESKFKDNIDDNEVKANKDDRQVKGDIDDSLSEGYIDDSKVKDDIDDSKFKGDKDDSKVKGDIDDSRVKDNIDDSQVKGDINDSIVKGDIDDIKVKDDIDDSKVEVDKDDSKFTGDIYESRDKTSIEDIKVKGDVAESKEKASTDDSKVKAYIDVWGKDNADDLEQNQLEECENSDGESISEKAQSQKQLGK